MNDLTYFILRQVPTTKHNSWNWIVRALWRMSAQEWDVNCAEWFLLYFSVPFFSFDWLTVLSTIISTIQIISTWDYTIKHVPSTGTRILCYVKTALKLLLLVATLRDYNSSYNVMVVDQNSFICFTGRFISRLSISTWAKWFQFEDALVLFCILFGDMPRMCNVGWTKIFMV